MRKQTAPGGSAARKKRGGLGKSWETCRLVAGTEAAVSGVHAEDNRGCRGSQRLASGSSWLRTFQNAKSLMGNTYSPQRVQYPTRHPRGLCVSSHDFFCLLLSSSPPFPNDLCVAVLTCESSAGVSWMESDVHPEGSQVEPRKRERGSLQDWDKNQKE